MLFADITADTLTAGPGIRVEYFTQGCLRGMTSPCIGCFNPSTWAFTSNKAMPSTPEHLTKSIHINTVTNKKITFCGGEPLLQGSHILKTIESLRSEEKGHEYNILFYLSYDLQNLLIEGKGFYVDTELEPDTAKGEGLQQWTQSVENLYNGLYRYTFMTDRELKKLVSLVDIIVDGEYDATMRLPKVETMEDGFFIGSANQKVYLNPQSKSNPLYLTEQIRDESVTSPFLSATEFNHVMEFTPKCPVCNYEREEDCNCVTKEEELV